MTETRSTLPPPMVKLYEYTQPVVTGTRPAGERAGFPIIAEVIPHEGQLKEGHVQGFAVRCDESERLGGTDSAPSPLGYFSLGIGFCFATHLAGGARRHDLDVRDFRVKVLNRFAREGSVLEGTIRGLMDSCSLEVDYAGDAPAEIVARLIAECEAGCFAAGGIRNAVPITVSATMRGSELPLPSLLK